MEQSPPKFLCDEMLQRLGRWLRAAGYDTRIAAEGESDYELLQHALREERLLITRDRGLIEHRRAPGTVILLRADNLEACAEELSRQVAIEWQFSPFTRCMVCNAALQEARPKQLSVLPLAKREFIDAAYFCPSCQQIFWEGSHVRRMRTHLQEWHERFSHH